VLFGPNVEWMGKDEGRYGLEAGKEVVYWGEPDDGGRTKEQFIESIKTYLPKLDPDRLSYSHCGLRPKLSHPDLPGYTKSHDFVVEEEVRTSLYA